MKKLIALLLTMMISFGICYAETTPIPDGTEVIVIFAQQDKQPLTKQDGRIEYLDTIWIYFTDYTFVQYAFIDETPVVFSTGTYSFANGGDFLYDKTEEDYGDIVIMRTAKYADGAGLQEYHSEHTYGLNTLGLSELFYGGDEDKKVVAVFAGCEKQTFNGELLDTYWIYYDNMTFDQYTCLRSDPILFSTGTYEFAGEPGDFSSVIVRREQKFQEGLNLAEYESEHTYHPFEMGYVMLAGKQTSSVGEKGAIPLAGGWQTVTAEAQPLPEDAQVAFDKATDGLVGVTYTPVALLSTQLVAGTNYCILCQITPVVLDAVPTWNLVYIYADLEGNAEIMNIWEIYIDKHAEPEDPFYIAPISDEIFERIFGKSFKEDCTLPREDLRYLHVLHTDLDGETHEGEMIVNYHIAEDVLQIFRELYDAKYPIEKIRLVDEYNADDELSMEDNNSSSFNFRFISHTTRVSKHGLGLAVDINTLYNPCTKTVDGERIVEPVTGEPYLDREAEFPYKIDHEDLCFKLFTEHGFEWGGDWEDRKDYQHFEIPTDVIKAWYPDNY